jgi:hypothetical protein
VLLLRSPENADRERPHEGPLNWSTQRTGRRWNRKVKRGKVERADYWKLVCVFPAM